MFKKRFIELCNLKKESPSYVCRQVGISSANYSQWTDESVPRKATLMRIADYFNVPVECLLSDEESIHTEKPRMSRMFWNNFVSLCNKNEVSPNYVAKELGISSGTVTGWKQGSSPRDTALQRIADYFNIPVEHLLSSVCEAGAEAVPAEKERKRNLTPVIGDIEKELLVICSKLDMKRKNALLTKAYELLDQK